MLQLNMMRLLFVVLPAACSATWSQFHGDSAHTGRSSATGPAGQQVCAAWTATLPSLSYSSPVLTNDAQQVIVGVVSAPCVVALDARTGNSNWTGGTACSMTGAAAISSVSSNLIVGFDGGGARVESWSPASGARQWSLALPQDVFSSMTLFPCMNECVAFTTGGSVLSVDTQQGLLLWTAELGAGDIYATPSFFQPPAGSHGCEVDGCLYVGTGNGSVIAIGTVTGSIVWQFEALWDITSTPVLSADMPSAFPHGVLYVGAGDGVMYALDADSGAVLWQFSASAGVACTPALSAPSSSGATMPPVLSFGTDDGNMYALNAQTGALVWVQQHDGAILSSPAVDAAGNLFVGIAAALCGINGTSGAIMWCYDAPSQILSSPAIGDDGTLYATSAGAFPGNNAAFALRGC